MKKNDLTERLLRFAVDVILFIRKVPDADEFVIVKKQLISSSTSAGANYEEAQGGSSHADFLNKVRIALKEMRETCYWLRIIRGIYPKEQLPDGCDTLIQESIELKNILGSICKKASRKTL